MMPVDPNVKRMKFHRKKNVWRRQVKRHIEAADAVARDHVNGIHISMGRLYETARNIAKTGDRGLQLRASMKSYDIQRVDRVHESIASTCKLLESASKVMEGIADKQGTPLVDFPLFTSDLHVTSDIALGANEALEALMQVEKE
jgi:hypothetical protein